MKKSQKSNKGLTIRTEDSKVKPQEKWWFATFGAIFGPEAAIGGFLFGIIFDQQQEKRDKTLGYKEVKEPSLWNAGVAKGLLVMDLITHFSRNLGGAVAVLAIGIAASLYFSKQHKKDMEHDWELAKRQHEEAAIKAQKDMQPQQESLEREQASPEITEWAEQITAKKVEQKADLGNAEAVCL
jgi:hypothetical protein